MADDSLDWWGKKPEEQKGQDKQTKKRRRKSISRGQFGVRLAIHCAVIGLLGLLLAVAAHYTLQGLTRHGANCVVPNLVDLTMAEAEALVAESELNLIINDSLYAPGVGRGVILTQLPAEGTVVKPGRSIYLSVNSMNRRMVTIPYVAGRSLRQAKNMLEVAGLVIERLEYEEDLATNYILGESYVGREITPQSTIQAAVGSGVTLRVGVNRGDRGTIVPDVMGRSITLARSALWSAGLNVGEVTSDGDVNAGNEHLTFVYRQSIEADSLVALGSSVSLRLTLHKEVLDSVYVERARAVKVEEARLKREQFVADSMAMFEVLLDTVEVEEVEVRRRPTVERVEFEDLF